MYWHKNIWWIRNCILLHVMSALYGNQADNFITTGNIYFLQHLLTGCSIISLPTFSPNFTNLIHQVILKKAQKPVVRGFMWSLKNVVSARWGLKWALFTCMVANRCGALHAGALCVSLTPYKDFCLPLLATCVRRLPLLILSVVYHLLRLHSPSDTYIRPKNICDDIFTLGKFKKLLLLRISLRCNIYNPSGRKSEQSNR